MKLARLALYYPISAIEFLGAVLFGAFGRWALLPRLLLATAAGGLVAQGMSDTARVLIELGGTPFPQLADPRMMSTINIPPGPGWLLVGTLASVGLITSHLMTYTDSPRCWYALAGQVLFGMLLIAALQGAVVLRSPPGMLRDVLSFGMSGLWMLSTARTFWELWGMHSPLSSTPVPADNEPQALRAAPPRLKLDDLAGMDELKAQLRGFARHFRPGPVPLRDRLRGRTPPPSDINGLLLGGPPGNGKTTFAEALAGELGFQFVRVGVHDLTSQWINDSPNKVREAFAVAMAAQPCVLFLDEFDAVARDRAGMTGSAGGEDIKVVNTLLQEIDRVRQHRVVLVAATNHVDRLDPAISRAGRFDLRIDVPYPDQTARVGILHGLLNRYRLQLEGGPATLERIAALWERRSVAFLESVAKQVREDLRAQGRSNVNLTDLKQAARVASRHHSHLPRGGTRLSELVLPAATRAEAMSLVHRLRHWESIAEQGGTPPSGVLLYGPPGTGKTHLVRAMALELGDWHIFEVKTAQILADPRQFEQVLDRAAQHRPAFIFIDEADELLRDRTYSPMATATNEILKAMDGMMGRVPEVVFVAATNHLEAIDAAARRGGRFAEKIYMDRLRGQDLVAFAQAEMTRRTKVVFDESLSPQWIASRCQEIAPADLIAVLDKAVNGTLGAGTARKVGRADVVRAMGVVMG